MNRFSLPVVVLFISSIGWGLTWWPLKYLNARGVEGPSLVFIAFGAAALMLLPVLLRQRPLWRAQWASLVLIALFGGFANLAFQIALYQGDVIRVMILFYLLPVWSVLGGWLFLGERIDSLRILTVVGALLGAVFILRGFSVFTRYPSWVDLLAIGSGMAFAMNNIIFRATQTLPLASKVSAVFIGCTLLIGGYLLSATGQIPAAPASTLWLTVAYGLFWISVITFGTQWAVTRLEAGRASIIIIMELVAAVVSASLLLDETLSAMEFLGGLLIVAAVLIETAREVQAQQTVEAPS